MGKIILIGIIESRGLIMWVLIWSKCIFSDESSDIIAGKDPGVDTLGAMRVDFFSLGILWNYD